MQETIKHLLLWFSFLWRIWLLSKARS